MVMNLIRFLWHLPQFSANTIKSPPDVKDSCCKPHRVNITFPTSQANEQCIRMWSKHSIPLTQAPHLSFSMLTPLHLSATADEIFLCIARHMKQLTLIWDILFHLKVGKTQLGNNNCSSFLLSVLTVNWMLLSIVQV